MSDGLAARDWPQLARRRVRRHRRDGLAPTAHSSSTPSGIGSSSVFTPDRLAFLCRMVWRRSWARAFLQAPVRLASWRRSFGDLPQSSQRAARRVWHVSGAPDRLTPATRWSGSRVRELLQASDGSMVWARRRGWSLLLFLLLELDLLLLIRLLPHLQCPC